MWLHHNHENIMSRAYKDKYEYMYLGIHNRRSKWAKFYWPISLFRRIIFIALPSIMQDYPYG